MTDGSFSLGLIRDFASSSQVEQASHDFALFSPN
jgi:hypothetical protein